MWALQQELVNHSNDRYDQSHILTRRDCRRAAHPAKACISDRIRTKTGWSADTAASLAWKGSLAWQLRMHQIRELWGHLNLVLAQGG